MMDVQVVSENELQRVKKIGRRIRACCPVHNSRDRDLSIAPYSDDYLTDEESDRAGFGYCHGSSCHAIILVKEWNPKAAARILGKPVRTAPPRITMTGEELDQAEEWQRRELAALNKIYDTAAGNLRHLRAYAYLAGRGLGSQEALELLEQMGAGYIPPAEEWKRNPPLELLRWCDRIIFPFSTRDDERGFIGRTLRLWTPGMDEREHKRLLDEHDRQAEEQYGKDAYKHQIRRWLKTYRSGFFNGQVMKTARHIYMTEGAFDAIPLMLAGLSNVVAVAGTHFDKQAFREYKKVLQVTLAYDADTQGQKSTELTLDMMRGLGLDVDFCPPPDDELGKDWSERYRRAGVAGLAVLLQTMAPVNQSADLDDNIIEVAAPELVTDNQGGQAHDDLPGDCSVCGAPVEYYDANGLPYCAAHWTSDIETSDDTPCVQDWPEPEPVTGAEVEESGALWEQIGREVIAARQLSKEEIIERVGNELGGSDRAKVTEHPPGYTLAEHVKHLREQREHKELAQEASYTQQMQVHRRSQDEFWAKLATRLDYPPVDGNRKPFYSRKKWRAIRAAQASALPDERLFSHYPGGYAGYCQRYR